MKKLNYLTFVFTILVLTISFNAPTYSIELKKPADLLKKKEGGGEKFDFMFNKVKNTSLSSKNDETLKLISFKENDKNKIIEIARKNAIDKVVVKEPVNSTSVLLKPNHIIKTKLISYNIYLGSNA